MNKKLPNLNKDHQVESNSPYSPEKCATSNQAEGGNTQQPKSAGQVGRHKQGIQSLTSEQVKHKLYVQPLMKFFHDCIDFERTIEIDK